MVTVTICQMYGYMDSYHPETIMTKIYQIQSPCPSNWSDDLQVIDDNKDESKEQMEQPTEEIITLTGTRVPQDTLTDTSTTLRLPQTMPHVLRMQKQNGKTKQKTRPPYARPRHGKSHKNKMAWNRNKENGRKENGKKYFIYLDVIF